MQNIMFSLRLNSVENLCRGSANNFAHLGVEGVVDPGHDPVDPVRLGEEFLRPGLATGLSQRLAQPHQQPRHHARAVPVVKSGGKYFDDDKNI